ncbi:hypothetical protein CALVIDRAFT_562490 [Calocera viscosa TUFC12733]|uniref:non-specific serine/threonine protein kinase n=1 Tax=Calocera viscosa (strain TUFC12733) TaxID=1330018 RepID=A0A167NUW4_CALVF|nr:hypothetical protein CALVIDRAFT_562490 [Calocera viscosa TUFC12733]
MSTGSTLDDVDDFSDFVRDFPQKYYADTLPYRKVGEASYSEVFGVGDIVLKIVPLLSDHKNGHAADEQPAETPIEDALREILFISRMGSLQGGSGFSALLGAHVVEGVYPSSLLSEWDRWDLCNKSESIRPGCFPESQLYAVIEMSYSGEDLEKYKFPKRTAWQQAASVFWQAARSIERAEHHLRFEHRDLHWGQVLILPVTHVVAEPTAYLDDPGHGVAVTVIDFGYSRMDAPNPEDPPLYTPFEPEVFEGQGDYQYDIYRMMRNHNGDKWDDYRPVTNLMWLHYLTVKLLKHKGLRKPLRAKGQAAAAFDREMRCYNALCETEELLRAVVQSYSRPQAAGKRRAIRGPQWQCGGDLCAWGREQQWIK